MADVGGWLSNFLGTVVLRVVGVDQTPSGAINFEGFTAAFDDSGDVTELTLTPVASTTAVAGSMSATDKTKLDGIQKQGPCLTIAALAIDWSLGRSFKKTLTAAASHTFTFANATSGWDITVRLSGAGTSTVTWPTVKWVGGAPPTQTHNGTDVYSFWHDGTDIFGSVLQVFA